MSDKPLYDLYEGQLLMDLARDEPVFQSNGTGGGANPHYLRPTNAWASRPRIYAKDHASDIDWFLEVFRIDESLSMNDREMASLFNTPAIGKQTTTGWDLHMIDWADLDGVDEACLAQTIAADVRELAQIVRNFPRNLEYYGKCGGYDKRGAWRWFRNVKVS